MNQEPNSDQSETTSVEGKVHLSGEVSARVIRANQTASSFDQWGVLVCCQPMQEAQNGEIVTRGKGDVLVLWDWAGHPKPISFCPFCGKPIIYPVDTPEE